MVVLFCYALIIHGLSCIVLHFKYTLFKGQIHNPKGTVVAPVDLVNTGTPTKATPEGLEEGYVAGVVEGET